MKRWQGWGLLLFLTVFVVAMPVQGMGVTQSVVSWWQQVWNHWTAEWPLMRSGAYYLVVDKKEHVLAVRRYGATVATYPVAIGKVEGQKEREGDYKTPEGVFPVVEIWDASAWTHDFGDGKGDIAHAYGPWFFYLDTTALSYGTWDGIGIHGTHDPSSLGTNASEGCIRMDNEQLQEVRNRYIQVGTAVWIHE